MNSLVMTGFCVGTAWAREADDANERTADVCRALERASELRATRDCMSWSRRKACGSRSRCGVGD